MTKRVQARVSGRVQGVGFRYYADHVAEQLGLAGTVRNTADGGIEAVAEGDEGNAARVPGRPQAWPARRGGGRGRHRLGRPHRRVLRLFRDQLTPSDRVATPSSEGRPRRAAPTHSP